MTDLYSDTITIFNRYEGGTFTGGRPGALDERWEKTVIKAVLWKDKTRTLPDSTGKPSISKTVNISIQKDLAEIEGNKEYVRPSEWIALPADADNVWTLQQGDIIIYGETHRTITALYTIDRLRAEYRSAEIREVYDSTHQDILPQWKVACL